MIKAVLFDLDGTLFDRDNSVRRVAELQHAAFASALAHVPRALFVDEFMERDARGYRKKDEVYQALSQSLAITGVASGTLFDDFVARYHTCCALFPGAEEVLKQLRQSGLRLGIITNGSDQFQLRTIQALGIEAYFSTILTSGAEGVKKPDAEIFRRACNRLGVEASETVFVGDHPVVDIEGARNAGLTAIWKRDDFWPPPTAADGQISDLRELPGLIHMIEGVN